MKTDAQRLDWLEKNYLNALGIERITFRPPQETWHPKLKAKYPNGYWTQSFGNKDDSNRWTTLREAIDAISER